MSTPAEVTYEPPLSGAGPCATAKCENQAQKYGPALFKRPSSPLCNVCLAQAQAKWRQSQG
ncbi:hypothetical protein [Streptomyces sp. Midd1]|uniref:hypothetical protein n=1 Tax=Streptomyces sp. Midd3 TaxID=3161191 RepID=UPI0034DB617B